LSSLKKAPKGLYNKHTGQKKAGFGHFEGVCVGLDKPVIRFIFREIADCHVLQHISVLTHSFHPFFSDLDNHTDRFDHHSKGLDNLSLGGLSVWRGFGV
jgi:hypothetical protein